MKELTFGYVTKSRSTAAKILLGLPRIVCVFDEVLSPLLFLLSENIKREKVLSSFGKENCQTFIYLPSPHTGQQSTAFCNVSLSYFQNYPAPQSWSNYYYIAFIWRPFIPPLWPKLRPRRRRNTSANRTMSLRMKNCLSHSTIYSKFQERTFAKSYWGRSMYWRNHPNAAQRFASFGWHWGQLNFEKRDPCCSQDLWHSVDHKFSKLCNVHSSWARSLALVILRQLVYSEDVGTAPWPRDGNLLER